MFSKSLALSAAFSSVVVTQVAAVATPLVDRDPTLINLVNQILIDRYATDGTNLVNFPTVLGYQIAPQFLIMQGFDANGDPGAQVDLYAQDIFRPFNDTSLNSGIIEPFFNFMSPVRINKLIITDDSPSIGLDSSALGERSAAFGAGANASFDRSTAVGEGAITTRPDQMVLGRQTTEVTVPNLSGKGSGVVSADSDGTLRRLAISGQKLERAIPRLESAARSLGQAIQGAGAISAAMSAVPELTLQEDEPLRCGFGTGGYGSQYAVAAGCAARISKRVHVNGALSYAPPVDYAYGQTSPVAGRVGVSFPLGKISNTVHAREIKSSETGEVISIKVSELVLENEKQSALIKSQQNEIIRLREDLARVLKRLQMDTGG